MGTEYRFEEIHDKRRLQGSPKKRRLRTGAVIALVVFVMLSAGAYWGYSILKGMYSNIGGTSLTGVKPGERINILVLGLDSGATASGKQLNVRSEAAATRTDTMILVSVDPESHKVGILWIPRDSRVKIPGRAALEKATHAHAYGGPSLAMQTVAQLLGVDIQYYVRTDFQGFARIVDVLGGIPIHINQNMQYEDPFQGLKIDLKAGDQVLNGDKALQFVRFRKYPTGDIGRVQAQQQFAKAVIAKVLQVGTIPKIPSIANEAMKWVDTNVEPSRVLSLANIARQVKETDIQIGMLPGEARDIVEHGAAVSYWVLDDAGVKKMVDRVIRGIEVAQNQKITVEVLDGSNRTAALTAASKALTDAGFVITKTGAADRKDYAATQFISRKESLDPAKEVARILSAAAPKSQIIGKVVKDSKADVTVIIGKDYTPK
jgi:polyisoprenyl-teichoic acid--peptidoglycan teichoic acid transferase